MTKAENNGIGFNQLLTIENPSQQLIREMLDAPVPRHINLRRMSVDFVHTDRDIEKSCEIYDYSSNTKNEFSKIKNEIWPKLIEGGYKAKRFDLCISEYRETKGPVQFHLTEINLRDNELKLFINNSDKSLNEDAKAVLRYWFENLREFKTFGKTEQLWYYIVRLPQSKNK